MPRLDRKGPDGKGPMTGRGLGKCNPENEDAEVDEKSTTMRGGRGPSNGNGFFGRGRGARGRNQK